MIRERHSKKVVLSGIFLVLGLLIPYFTAHAFGLPGNILLPMHIPVLLCGLLCGARYGLLCGIATPLLSSLLLGMPTAYPMLPIMLLQLAAMGFLSGLLYGQGKRNLYGSLAVSMLAGWFCYGVVFSMLLLASGNALRAPSVITALLAGIPGMAVQLLLIPSILFVLKHYRLLSTPSQAPASEDMIREASALIQAGSCGCVVIQDGKIVHMGTGRGVSPLILLYQEQVELLSRATVVDKIIGKAAAMLLVLGGVSKVHALTMSIAAKDYLTKHGIAVSYERLIDVIANRNRDGICSVERSVLALEDPAEGLVRMQEAIQALMRTG